MPSVYAGVRQRAVTSPTVQAQTAAASPTWIRTSHHGSWLRHCSSPTRHLHEQEHEQADRAGSEHARALTVADEPGEQEQEADAERRGRADVEVDGVEQVPEAVDVGAVARVRAGGGRERAGDDEDRRTRARARARRSRSHVGAGTPRGRARSPQASTATTVAVASTTSASRKCVATISGCRSSRIVSRPSGACAIVPRKVNAGEPRHPAAEARRASAQRSRPRARARSGRAP